jgi:hypothetical protein
VTADHCAEEQRDEYPTNQLSLEHCDILHTDNDFFFVTGRVGYQWRFNIA